MEAVIERGESVWYVYMASEMACGSLWGSELGAGTNNP
jgi:hypothetical protein